MTRGFGFVLWLAVSFGSSCFCQTRKLASKGDLSICYAVIVVNDEHWCTNVVPLRVLLSREGDPQREQLIHDVVPVATSFFLQNRTLFSGWIKGSQHIERLSLYIVPDQQEGEAAEAVEKESPVWCDSASCQLLVTYRLWGEDAQFVPSFIDQNQACHLKRRLEFALEQLDSSLDTGFEFFFIFFSYLVAIFVPVAILFSLVVLFSKKRFSLLLHQKDS